jgi:ABC-type Fe3+-hydroxamate transport system substrate-binding protein
VRIVSLVPSLSELLADLGTPPVGVTRFCVRPPGLKEQAAIVGGTKQIDPERVAALRPDWILANKEENTAQMVDAVGDLAPIHVTDVQTVDGALAMIRRVGAHVGRGEAADRMASEIARRFDALPPARPLRCAYLIWRDPLMTVGADTFISDVMARAGLSNAFSDRTRYPTTDEDELRRLDLDAVLLSSEPFPFKRSHADALHEQIGTPALLVDGEPFSWYGSRLLDAPAYLRGLRAELESAGAR